MKPTRKTVDQNGSGSPNKGIRCFSRVATLIIALRPAIRLYDGFARPSVSLLLRAFLPVSALAVPAVLTNPATQVCSAIANREMAQFGTDAVAGMAIIGRMVPVAFSVVFGLSDAIEPIVGQKFGARLQPRVKEAFWDSLRFTLIYVLAMALLLFPLREQVANLFAATGMARNLILLFCGLLALIYIFSGSIYVLNAAFNNLGHPLYSTWVNWGVHTLGLLPLVKIGAVLPGAPGVLIGQAAGQVLFAVVSVLLARHVIANPAERIRFDPFDRHRRTRKIYSQGNR